MPDDDDPAIEPKPSDALTTIRALVAAHDVPDARRGGREPIWYIRFHGDVMHHALDAETKPSLDEGLIEEMQSGSRWRRLPPPGG